MSVTITTYLSDETGKNVHNFAVRRGYINKRRNIKGGNVDTPNYSKALAVIATEYFKEHPL